MLLFFLNYISRFLFIFLIIWFFFLLFCFYCLLWLFLDLFRLFDLISHNLFLFIRLWNNFWRFIFIFSGFYLCFFCLFLNFWLVFFCSFIFIFLFLLILLFRWWLHLVSINSGLKVNRLKNWCIQIKCNFILGTIISDSCGPWRNRWRRHSSIRRILKNLRVRIGNKCYRLASRDKCR